MNSPVIIPFHSFVKIDRRKKEAIYMQIVYQFINAVKVNLLEDSDRLPGSRIIAEELQVHRKTVVAALEELKEQGWVKTRPNIGTFVRNPELSPAQIQKNKVFQHPPEEAAFNFRKDFILDTPLEENLGKFYFTDGTPDYRIIKSEELVRFYTSVLKRKKQSGIFLNATDGSLFFRDQLSYYLNLTRGFHLSRDFLLPVAGLEKVHSILSRLLINTGDLVLVEELSYFLPNMIYSQAGAKMKTIPLDADGMDIDFIEKNFKPGEIRLVYINTKCQYPTTVGLSEKRKTQLLDLAEAYDFIVIEDDTDFEFSLVKNKKESLFRKNGGNRVIYVGSFGRFLSPSFQMNFITAPKDLLREGAKYLNVYGKPDSMMEKALGELIHQGDIHRYQRKSKKIISERKEIFTGLLNAHFKNRITFTTPSSGLAFWIRFSDSFSLTLLQKKAREKGLFIPSICLYQNRTIIGLRLGFTHLNPQEMEEAVKLLEEAYREVIA
ncbi:PLP-dependent aminotransferase family protein [Bizionia argentinensis JUB59]|uniref:PLP-dependent aminotransferase family protein n=1 Tax=Bizionia argentinensis JUB59 TaxID=1046627 RepID=G2EGT3_9FLAO|nr:PLP-dependent aminotransferase family protein [Bizionia argentinensis]EGV42355.2 PLP-dependent aminotransferase family protein [Bizionia argentinensis JUB59]